MNVIEKILFVGLKMELCTKVNGKIKKEMDMEFKHGQMVQNMKENGRIIKLVVREHFII